jgi:general secretion pathway protein D
MDMKRFAYGTIVMVLVVLFFSGGAATLSAEDSIPSVARPQGIVQRYVTIDFNDVDINLFIKYISELTKKNFIVDREVSGKVTIISPTRISEDEAYRVFESVLEVHGFATVPSGSVIKIVPAVHARAKSIATLLESDRMLPEDKVVTQIVTLRHAGAEEVKNMLTPLVSRTAVMIAYGRSDMLIITDFHSNICACWRLSGLWTSPMKKRNWRFFPWSMSRLKVCPMPSASCSSPRPR